MVTIASDRHLGTDFGERFLEHSLRWHRLLRSSRFQRPVHSGNRDLSNVRQIPHLGLCCLACAASSERTPQGRGLPRVCDHEAFFQDRLKGPLSHRTAWGADLGSGVSAARVLRLLAAGQEHRRRKPLWSTQSPASSPGATPRRGDKALSCNNTLVSWALHISLLRRPPSVTPQVFPSCHTNSRCGGKQRLKDTPLRATL